MAGVPFFSIIVPTHARPRCLATCLQSLTGLDYSAKRWEVIVVDDGSQTPAENVVAPFRSRLNVTLLTQNRAGPAAARNTGAQRAKGEFSFLRTMIANQRPIGCEASQRVSRSIQTLLLEVERPILSVKADTVLPLSSSLTTCTSTTIANMSRRASWLPTTSLSRRAASIDRRIRYHIFLGWRGRPRPVRPLPVAWIPFDLCSGGFSPPQPGAEFPNLL